VETRTGRLARNDAYAAVVGKRVSNRYVGTFQRNKYQPARVPKSNHHRAITPFDQLDYFSVTVEIRKIYYLSQCTTIPLVGITLVGYN
jgi:hypothetical protein